MISFCDHVISPCCNKPKSRMQVLVSVAISIAVLCVASYLRVFRIQRKHRTIDPSSRIVRSSTRSVDSFRYSELL